MDLKGYDLEKKVFDRKYFTYLTFDLKLGFAHGIFTPTLHGNFKEKNEVPNHQITASDIPAEWLCWTDEPKMALWDC